MKTEEIGTLSELGVKAGDVVEMVNNSYHEFIGEQLTIQNDGRAMRDGFGFFDPSFDDIYSRIYRIISRADAAPKTWGEMTDAEKGALLLAREFGATIEMERVSGWESMTYGQWIDGVTYRIKAEPVIDTVVLYGRPDIQWVLEKCPHDTHRITFATIDGEPDCSSIKMEKL